MNHIPLLMSIMVGKYLGHNKSVRSDSFVFCGKSYNMKLFCDALYNDIITEVGADVDLFEDENDDDGTLIGEELSDATIKGGSMKTNLLRVCVLNVWTKKLDTDGAPFSTCVLINCWEIGSKMALTFLVPAFEIG